ncbi:GGDEF domain-containing protein [Congregibacter brevis]|uniref:diguanylate cyclase n=1 Tax=Congregibacter brevis TaxID=3081201 RepID=A0ABZ0IHT2_9GAMM|nr:GGDEF domain-containing protein [Congregibacter sp. IMCC45268]
MSLSSPDPKQKQLSLLSRLTLRQRLAVAFTTGVFAAGTLALTSYIAVDFSGRQAEQLEYASAQLDFVNGLSIAASEVQLAATRYVHYGHQSAYERVNSVIRSWSERIDVCEENGCLKEGQIDDIRVHLQAFDESFLLVAKAYNEISESLNSDLKSVHDFAPEQEHLVGSTLVESELPSVHINSFNDHVATIEAELRAYFVSSDAQRVQDAEAHLAELRVHAALADAELRSERGPLAQSAESAFNIDQIEDTLYGNIQKIRSYAYLVNVVMPSEARELEYLANEIATAKNLEISALRADMHRNRMNVYRWQSGIITAVLVLSVPIFFWVLNSVTSPLRHLAGVFRQLSVGSEEDVVGTARTQDEIGDLFLAAEAFRQENIRERELLADYRELSRGLEAQVAARTRELQLKNEELDRLASIDKLTDTYNRRALDEALATELRRALRYERSFALLIMDIDLFKQVNDTHGHLRGDQVLTTLAKQIKANLRHSDILGRWGGEEFLVICPETGVEQARSVAEKVRAAVEGTDFGLPDRITISIGISSIASGSTTESLVADADRALYLAKNQGRNRVCVSPMTLTPQTA